MPPLETCRLHQKAVLWAFAGYDNYGDVTVSAAVEVDVRWETVNRESLDAQGNSISIDSVVVVDRVVAVGSIVWLGEVAGIATPPVNRRQARYQTTSRESSGGLCPSQSIVTSYQQ